MCHFITLVVRGSDGGAIDRVLRQHGRQAKPIANASIGAVLVAGEAQFLTTVGHCDCGTALARVVSDRAGERSDQAEKLAKKGWSQAKIDRWLSDRVKADDRGEQRRHGTMPDSIEVWTRIIGDLLGTPGVQQAGLLLHYYSGDVEEESIELVRETAPLRDFESRLRAMREDQILMATT